MLSAIGHAVPEEGLAALRFWGQTGERSSAWMAAAEPVYFDPRHNHLCLFAIHADDLSLANLREIVEHLQETLGDDERYAFGRLGRCAYLRGDEPFATAALSPAAIDGRAPDEFMPQGEVAASHDRLLSELQMALHDHALNQQRVASGKRPVNSIWLWGGGSAPEEAARPIPSLVSDDPLFRGYWASCAGSIADWTDDFDDCLNAAPDGFVNVVPDEAAQSHHELMAMRLDRLRQLLRQGELSKLTLQCRDGLAVEIGKHDVWRFWRKVSPLLKEANNSV